MKKLSSFILFVFCLSAFSLSAQKVRQIAATPRTLLASESDSLAYAYGVGAAKQGLTAYLTQKGLLIDTAQIMSNYTNRITDAVNHTEKSRLNRELKFKLDSIRVSNDANLKGFLKGINESLTSNKKNPAYLTGIELGNQIVTMSDGFFKESLQGGYGNANYILVAKGIEDVLSNKKILVKDAETMVENKFNAIKAKDDEVKKKENTAIIEVGEKFLTENKSRVGVVVLPSGLQYQVVKEGQGAKPTASDKVKVHYHGMLIDGTVFDSSVDRGEPIVLGVSEVIKGWTEALQLMPVGSKWILYIPYELGYGANSTGKIPAFATLVFEVELLDIENK